MAAHIDTRGLSRSELIEQWARQKSKNALSTMRSKEFQKRTENAGYAVLGAAAGATIPAWILERNPEWKYLDNDETIETEAIVAIGATVGGVAAYLADVDYSEAIMVAGLVTGGCYLNNIVRVKARQANAEEADQQAAA